MSMRPCEWNCERVVACRVQEKAEEFVKNKKETERAAQQEIKAEAEQVLAELVSPQLHEVSHR